MLSASLRTRLEKTAHDNGFELHLPQVGEWLAFARPNPFADMARRRCRKTFARRSFSRECRRGAARTRDFRIPAASLRRPRGAFRAERARPRSLAVARFSTVDHATGRARASFRASNGASAQNHGSRAARRAARGARIVSRSIAQLLA